MENSHLKRINELAAKAKSEGLTPEEEEERRVLHEAYLKEFRAYMRGTLDNTVIERPDGTREKIRPKTDKERN